MAKIATQIRLEEDTYKKIKYIANRELRTMNAQMEYFLLWAIGAFEKTHGLTPYWDVDLSGEE
jgi:hypothetical protein